MRCSKILKNVLASAKYPQYTAWSAEPAQGGVQIQIHVYVLQHCRTINEGNPNGSGFCKNLHYGCVLWANAQQRQDPTPQLITHSHGHLSWADMLHHERPATSSAVKTCSFNCCISLCMHAHDPQRRGGRVHFVLEVTCVTYPNGKKAVR